MLWYSITSRAVKSSALREFFCLSLNFFLLFPPLGRFFLLFLTDLNFKKQNSHRFVFPGIKASERRKRQLFLYFSHLSLKTRGKVDKNIDCSVLRQFSVNDIIGEKHKRDVYCDDQNGFNNQSLKLRHGRRLSCARNQNRQRTA